MKAVLGIDVGTSAAKALVLGEDGKVWAKGRAPYPTLTPRPGLVEQDPEAWWRAAAHAARACLGLCGTKINIVGLGFSGHMSVLLPLDRHLRPLRPAITIADPRGDAEARWLNTRFGAEIAAATGNKALPAFTLPKGLWYKEHEPERFARTRVFVGVKDYLRLRATDTLGTEPTDAGNTLLLEHASRRWNEALLERLGLSQTLLPPLGESLDVVGALTEKAATAFGLPSGLPVIAGLADMAASVLGCGLTNGTRLAITLGTSGQITQVVGKPAAALWGKFTYHPHALPGKTYVMASLFTGGLGLQWLAELLSSLTGIEVDSSVQKILQSAEESEPGARGVLFLPYLTGSGSPRFGAQRTASFLGLSRHHRGGDVSRAVLEGVGFSVRHCLEYLATYHAAPHEVVVGGGGMSNPLWRDIISDITGYRLLLLQEGDAGALGTALAVGAGIGLFADPTRGLEVSISTENATEPNRSRRATYDRAYQRYLQSIY